VSCTAAKIGYSVFRRAFHLYPITSNFCCVEHLLRHRQQVSRQLFQDIGFILVDVAAFLFFWKLNTNIQRTLLWVTTSLQYSPLLPCPARPSHFLTSLPPRSASTMHLHHFVDHFAHIGGCQSLFACPPIKPLFFVGRLVRLSCVVIQHLVLWMGKSMPACCVLVRCAVGLVACAQSSARQRPHLIPLHGMKAPHERDGRGSALMWKTTGLARQRTMGVVQQTALGLSLYLAAQMAQAQTP